MANKAAHVVVRDRQCRNNPEKMIRRFIKKCKKAKVIELYKEKQFHKKPSVAKKEKRKRAIRREEREKQKRIRAQERRNRRKR